MKKFKVYEINGVLVVADSVEKAIHTFKQEYPFPTEVETVKLIVGQCNSSLALYNDLEEEGIVPPPGIEDEPPIPEESITQYLDDCAEGWSYTVPDNCVAPVDYEVRDNCVAPVDYKVRDNCENLSLLEF